jgi:ubiquitin carboxyl-terminal hydrolase 7
VPCQSIIPETLLLGRYAGRLLVKDTGKPIDILERLNEMAGFAPDEEVELFEVSL